MYFCDSLNTSSNRSGYYFMTFFKYIYITCTAFLCFSCNQGNKIATDNENIVLDSLLNICRTNLFTSAGFESARSLKQEAFRQENDLYVGYAYKYLLLTALNTQQKDSIETFGNRAKYYFNKIDNKEEIFKIDVSLIEWEMQYGSAYIALDQATQLLDQAKGDNYNEFYTYELISNIYNILGKSNKAETAFLKMLEIKNTNNLSVDFQMPYIYLRGAQIETSLKEYKQSLAYCDSSQVYIERYYNNDKTLLMLLNLNKVNNYIGLKDLDKAKATLNALDNFTQNNREHQFYYYIQSAWAEYYKASGDYKEALAHTLPAIERYEKTSDTPNYRKSRVIQAEILALMKDYKSAYELTLINKAYSDSIAMADADKQLNELQTLYQVDRLQNKLEQDALKAKNTRIIIFSLLLRSLTLLIITILVIRNSVIIKRKNEKLFSQYKERDKQDDMKSMTLSQKKDKSYLSLFERIELYLDESKAYRDPSLNRESLALVLGTNRQYLTQAIQEGSNMTFTEYINDFKLNYARRLLSENINLPIDEVYINAGFNNKSTFYRLFKQKYDLTPKEFQKIAVDQHSRLHKN